MDDATVNLLELINNELLKFYGLFPPKVKLLHYKRYCEGFTRSSFNYILSTHL